MFVKYPQHLRVAHYLIHVYDAPPLAQEGLPNARRYSDIAPDAPHALHMPSHIFTRVGDWDHSDATNRRSFKAAVSAGDHAAGLSRKSLGAWSPGRLAERVDQRIEKLKEEFDTVADKERDR